MSILRTLLILLEVVLIFNLMIIVHEIGHFVAARWRGLVVEKFGIWFGKPLWKKTINRVEYSLGSIPAGGFVALPQMAPMEVMEGKVETPREALPPISALDKIIVAFAGPLFSILLACFFAFVVYGIGRPQTEGEVSTTVGYVAPGSPAEKAGLLPGDKILTVDGDPVKRFGGMSESVSWSVIKSQGNTIDFVVDRNGKTETVTSTFQKDDHEVWQRAGFRQVGVGPAETPRIAKIAKGSAAEKAGLQPLDYIVGVNSQKVYGIETLEQQLSASAAPSATFDVEREGKVIQVPVQVEGPLIDSVMKNGPAEVAGIQKGDRIVAVNGKPVFSSGAVFAAIQAAKDQVLTLDLKRKDSITQVKVKPAVPDRPKNYKNPMLGIGWAPDSLAGITWDGMGRVQIVHTDPVTQLKAAAMTLVNTVGALFTKGSDVSVQHLSGPVGIMNVYYRLFQNEYGWQMALWFSVVLNVNLAIMNMLPIPVLDGGHITLALVEAARRRPVNTKFLVGVQTACAYVIMGFLAYVSFFDIGDLFGRRKVVFERPVPAVTEASP
jgi:regulator of sigma E protease